MIKYFIILIFCILQVEFKNSNHSQCVEKDYIIDTFKMRFVTDKKCPYDVDGNCIVSNLLISSDESFDSLNEETRFLSISSFHIGQIYDLNLLPNSSLINKKKMKNRKRMERKQIRKKIRELENGELKNKLRKYLRKNKFKQFKMYECSLILKYSIDSKGSKYSLPIELFFDNLKNDKFIKRPIEFITAYYVVDFDS